MMSSHESFSDRSWELLVVVESSDLTGQHF